jgi:hypothetical protein
MAATNSFPATIRSEALKFRSVRSTVIGLVVTFVLTVGLGALVCTAVAHANSHSGPGPRTFANPIQVSMVGSYLANFALGVIGAIFITAEYATGSIRTTLAAVPKRTRLILAKVVVLFLAVVVVAEASTFSAFLVGQAILKSTGTSASLSNSTALRAVLLTGLFMTFLSVIGFSLGLLLRQTAGAISVFVGLLLVLPLITNFLPASWQNHILKFEPMSLGRSLAGLENIRSNALFTPWVAFFILIAYVVVLLGSGIALMERRDA